MTMKMVAREMAEMVLGSEMVGSACTDSKSGLR